MPWMSMLRRRALWIVVAIVGAAVGLISVASLPAWPVVGAAVAAVALALNSLTARVAATTCLACGKDIGAQTPGAHGRVCPHCGAVNERVAGAFFDDDKA